MRQVATRLFIIDCYNTNGRLRASVDEISPQVSPFLLSQTPQLQVLLLSLPSFHHDYNHHWMGKCSATNLMIESIPWPSYEYVSRFSHWLQKYLIDLLPRDKNLSLQVAG